MKRFVAIFLVFLIGCNDEESASITADTLVLPSDYMSQPKSFEEGDVRASAELQKHYQQRAATALANWLVSPTESSESAGNDTPADVFVNKVSVNRLGGDFGQSRLAAFNILAGSDEARDVWLSRFGWLYGANDFLAAFAALNSQLSSLLESEGLFFHDSHFSVRAGFLDELDSLLGFVPEVFDNLESPDTEDEESESNDLCYVIAGTSRCLRNIVADRASFSSGLSLSLDFQEHGFSYSDDLIFAAGGIDYRTVPGFSKTATFGVHSNAAADFVKWDIAERGLSLIRIEPKDSAALEVLLEGDFFTWLDTVLVDSETTLTLPGEWSNSGYSTYYRATAEEVNQLGELSGEGDDRVITQPFLTRMNPDDRVLIRVDYSLGRASAVGERQTLAFTEIGLHYSQSSSETLLNLDSFLSPSGDGGGGGIIITNPGLPQPIPCFIEQPEAEIRPALYVVSETTTNTPISYFAIHSLDGDELPKTGFINNADRGLELELQRPTEPSVVENFFFNNSEPVPQRPDLTPFLNYPFCFLPEEHLSQDELDACFTPPDLPMHCSLVFEPQIDNCGQLSAEYLNAANDYKTTLQAAFSEFLVSDQWLTTVADYQQQLLDYNMSSDFETCFPLGE